MNKIKETFWAYRNKLSNKLNGTAHIPAIGKKKGNVLISYFVEPFTQIASKGFSNFHTMYWECYEIARLFSERGYACDIIDMKDKKFIPKKKYAVCFDAGYSFERWSNFLPKECKKIYPILMSNWKEYNEAEKIRLENLKIRRGVSLLPRRALPPTTNPKLADFLLGFGNKAVFATYEQFHKPITFIPISCVIKYDFQENKDWDRTKKNFLWIGGGGMVLKGLDIVLEAFKKMPDLELHVCGPVHGEPDFVKLYEQELNNTPNIHHYGRLDVGGDKFKSIIDTCSTVVYPSGGDGTSGAIVQVMHAGIIPLISHETGIQENSGYIPLTDPTPEAIIEAVRKISNLSNTEIKTKAKSIWDYARRVYTREEFSKAYANFMDNVLKI